VVQIESIVPLQKKLILAGGICKVRDVGRRFHRSGVWIPVVPATTCQGLIHLAELQVTVTTRSAHLRVGNRLERVTVPVVSGIAGSGAIDHFLAGCVSTTDRKISQFRSLGFIATARLEPTLTESTRRMGSRAG